MKTPRNGWSRSWSGRGIALLNAIEMPMKNEPIFKSNKNKCLSTEEKLKALLERRPANKFYQSLRTYAEKRPLTAKQTQCIESDYRRHCL
jgi:hypothetical protein